MRINALVREAALGERIAASVGVVSPCRSVHTLAWTVEAAKPRTQLLVRLAPCTCTASRRHQQHYSPYYAFFSLSFVLSLSLPYPRACPCSHGVAPLHFSAPTLLRSQAALIFTAVVTFVEVAFVKPNCYVDALFVVNRCIDTIFIVDMFLQFFLMYPQQPKSVQDTVRWVHDQDRIAMNYLKSWFPVDLVSILVSVFDIIPLFNCEQTGTSDAPSSSESQGASQLKVLRIIRILRLIKLVRLVRSSRIMKRFESRMAINYGHLALVKCLVGLLIASHWYACIWGLIATFESDNFDNTWYTVFGYCYYKPPDTSTLGQECIAYGDSPPQKCLSDERMYVCAGPTVR